MARLEIRCLGTFQVIVDGAPVTAFESNRVRALLVYLSIEKDRPQRREALAGLLWPDWPNTSALSNLRYALSKLREDIGDRQVDPPFLLISRDTIQFNPACDHLLDAAAFEEQVTAARQQLSAGGDRQSAILADAIRSLQTALEMYQGDFLGGITLVDNASFDEWVNVQREHFHRLALQALNELAQAHEAAGELEQALSCAYRQVEIEPWLEEGHQQVMRLLALSGQRSQALVQYETCRKVLREQMQVEPSLETTHLYEAIRDGKLEKISAPQAEEESLPPAPGEPPFKGLQYFDGREQLTARLVGHLYEMDTAGGAEAQGSGPLYVVGASSSGKSSAVRAGLVPALKQGPGARSAWLWAGIVIVALLLAGVVGAGIITQGFGLLKTQPMVTQAGTQIAFQASFQGTTTTPPTAGETPQPAVTDTTAPSTTPRSTLTPTLTGTATLAPTPTPSSPVTLTLPVLVKTPIPQPLPAISPQNAGRVAALARWDINKDELAVWSVAFSPDGTTLASGGHYGNVKLWRVSDGRLLSNLDVGMSYVRSIVFSPDGATLVSGGSISATHFGTVELWRVSDGKLLSTLTGHTDWVRSVAFSPDGATLASCSQDDTVKLWRVSDSKLLFTLQGHTEYVMSVAFSPDGKTLASGSWDKTVKLWRVSDGSLLRTLQDTNAVNSIAFSPDGTTLASGSDDWTVKLWRVSDGRLLSTLWGHTGNVLSVAFSPDGMTLASGSLDNMVKLWRVSDGSLLSTLTGHTAEVDSVVFSHDGTLLASGSGDATIRLWGVP